MPMISSIFPFDAFLDAFTASRIGYFDARALICRHRAIKIQRHADAHAWSIKANEFHFGP